MVLQCLQLCLHVLMTSLLVKPLLEFLSGSSLSAICLHVLMTSLLVKPASVIVHYDDTPMQYTAIIRSSKNYHFQMKNCDFFLIFAQNIDCGLKLVRTAPQLGGSYKYPLSLF